MNATSYRKLQKAKRRLQDAIDELGRATAAEQHPGDRSQIEQIRKEVELSYLSAAQIVDAHA